MAIAYAIYKKLFKSDSSPSAPGTMGKVQDKDLNDLRGKVVLITGSNSGLGFTTLQFLVRRGAKVYMGARSESKAKAAIKKLEAGGMGTMGGSVIWHEVDISHPSLAKKAGEKFLERERRLDILINNAGVIETEKPFTEEGVSAMMQINYLGPYAFTEALLPLLRATAAEPNSDVRIVNLSSSAHAFAGKIDTFRGKESLNKRFGDSIKGNLGTYGYSKVAVMLYTRNLQQTFDREGVPITCITVHPGSVATGGALEWLQRMPIGFILVPLAKHVLFITEVQGGMTSAFAAASTKVSKNRAAYKAKYLVPFGKIEKPLKASEDDKLMGELMQTTKEVLGEYNMML